MTQKITICCPKCGSKALEKHNNQEYQCTTCKEVFYFVTPNAGSAINSDRYKL